MYKQKEKIKQNKILKESRGITLIALVITIIVLLILAGVSIAILMGQENILENASGAKEQTNEAVENEKLKLAVSSARINGQGNLSKGKLQDAIGEQFGEEKKERLKGEEEGPWIFEGDTENYNIYKQGTINVHVSASEVNRLIGKTVDYEISNGVVGWKIFYASEKEMFLISSNTVDSNTAYGSDRGIPLRRIGADKDYGGALDVFATSYGATYNGMWKAKNPTDNYESSKATAYLCDPANWTKYLGKNAPSGAYAVGGPTKELFVLSWNKAVENGGDGAPTVTAIWEDGDVNEKGYTETEPYELCKSNPIKQTILDGLYNNGSDYRIASPRYGRTALMEMFFLLIPMD